MQFDILTLFPNMFTGPLTESIIKRAVQAGRIGIGIHDIRTYATDKHHTADDAPYGGGAGMVMKVEPLAAAIRDVLNQPDTDKVTSWQSDKAIESEAGDRPITPSPRQLVILM